MLFIICKNTSLHPVTTLLSGALYPLNLSIVIAAQQEPALFVAHSLK